MNRRRTDPSKDTPGYPEPEPQPAHGEQPDEHTPHEPHNEPTRKPQPSP